MEDLPTIISGYLAQYDSIDIAESEFKRAMHEDQALHEAYRQWCDEVGSTEKNGFFDFAEEYRDRQADIWNTLSDYDEQ